MSIAPAVQLSASLDAMEAVDPHRCSAGELVAALPNLERERRRLDAQMVRLLAAADERDATVEETGRTTRAWLVEEHNLSRRDAWQRVRIALELPAYPQLEAAFRAAKVTIEHVWIIIAALLEAPVEFRDAMEQALLELALISPPFLVSRAVDAIREQLGIERTSEQRRMRRDAHRHVDVDETFGGAGALGGTLTPETLDAARKAFDAADAGKPGGAEDTRTAVQRRHDAFDEIMNFFLTHAQLSHSNGERPRVVVTIDLDTLINELSTRCGMLDSGVEISPTAARRLACDAEIIPAVLDAKGDVLDVGHATRVFTTAIRRGVTLRDGYRCAFPKCQNRPRELHHIVWWSLGGKTTIDNACWLCTFHHHLVHDQAWTVARQPDLSYRWTSPRGKQFTGEPPPPRHPRVASAVQELSRRSGRP